MTSQRFIYTKGEGFSWTNPYKYTLAESTLKTTLWYHPTRVI